MIYKLLVCAKVIFCMFHKWHDIPDTGYVILKDFFIFQLWTYNVYDFFFFFYQNSWSAETKFRATKTISISSGAVKQGHSENLGISNRPWNEVKRKYGEWQSIPINKTASVWGIVPADLRHDGTDFHRTFTFR